MRKEEKILKDYIQIDYHRKYTIPHIVYNIETEMSMNLFPMNTDAKKTQILSC
jgi:hypothetical protein